MTAAPVRIAFPPIGGEHWMGGRNYLNNLVQALLAHEAGRVHPILIVDPEYAPDMVSTLEAAGASVIRDGRFAQARQSLRLMKALLTGCDQMAAQVYRNAGVDLVFESANYHGWRFPIPTLTWIPDFQHRHMPHMFGRAAWMRRDVGFRVALARGEDVLLSSQDAASDLRRFYPKAANNVHVVPFAVPAPPKPSDLAINEIRTSLGLPDRWLFLPNQFWQHKNHPVVVEALAIARRTCPDIAVVCTGNAHDPRNPDGFAALMQRAADLRVKRHFLSLGLVPYSQVTALFHGAVALINPSLFEGWSTVVEEAKSMGKPMILSDLSVHREQCGNNARYFVRNDPADCARAMVEAWTVPETPGRENNSSSALAAVAKSFARAAIYAASAA